MGGGRGLGGGAQVSGGGGDVRVGWGVEGGDGVTSRP